MKKREILCVLMVIFFIGCGSPSEFNPNVNITIDDNTTIDTNKSQNLPINTSNNDTNISSNSDTNSTCTPLLKTGQSNSYYTNDDGDLQKGVARSYTRDDQNKIVTDNATKLMWQDDENIKKPWIAQNGDTATSYCESLKLGGYEDWRLPSSDELYYLVDRGYEKPSINPIFQNISFDDRYWSSTISKDSSKVWSISFDDGDNYDHDKNSNFFVKCVRGQNKIKHNFVKDPTKRVVTDTKTCLMWQDSISPTLMTWEKAMDYCNDLKFENFSNWRVPNINELNSIKDTNAKRLMVNKAFSNISTDGYWSSTTQANHSNFAWSIYFDNGYTTDDNKSITYRVRCVR